MKKAILAVVLLAGIFVCAGIGEAAMSEQEFVFLCARGTPREIEAAIKNGADVNAKFALNGETALMAAAEQNPDPGVIALLLKNGAKINAVDKGRRPAISYAALHNPNPEVVLFLLKNGADVSMRDQNGFKAIDYVGRGNSKLEGTEALRQLKKANDIEEFFDLCMKGTPDKIKAAIDGGADVNAKNNYGTTALMVAALRNPNPEVVLFLLKNGADAQARDNDGNRVINYAVENKKLTGTEAFRQLQEVTGIGSAVMSAREFLDLCMKGTPDKIKAAIDGGANVNTRGDNDWTALIFAVNNPNPEVIALLLERGADVNAKGDNGWTALTLAVLNNPNPEVVSLLLKNGADVNVDAKGMGGKTSTALMLAVFNNPNPEVASLLLKNGANVNAKGSDGSTALMFAAMNNPNPEVVSFLLKNGADAQARNKDGKRAIDYAGGNKNLTGTEAFKQLQEASAKPTMSAQEFVDLCEKGAPDKVKAAIDGGADVNANAKGVGFAGRTALMSAAAENPNPEVIALLLERGADVNAKASVGFTALMFAAEKRNPEVIALLLKNGADVNAKAEINGLTALIAAAAQNPNPEVVSLLLKNGADVNAKNNRGGTALMSAALRNPNPEVVSLLLNNGADAQVVDSDRKMAIDHAGKNEKLTGTAAFKQLQEASGGKPVEASVVISELRGLKAATIVYMADHAGEFPIEKGNRVIISAKAAPKIAKLANMFDNPKKFDSGLYYISATKNGGLYVGCKVEDSEIRESLNSQKDSAGLIVDEVDHIYYMHAAGAESTRLEAIKQLQEVSVVTPAPEVKPTTPEVKPTPAPKPAAEPKPTPEPKSLDDAAFIELCKSGTAQAIDEAIKAGANVNAKDENGFTALMTVARSHEPEVAALLLKNGADVNAIDKDGVTVLMYAATRNPEPEIIALLLENGADVNAKEKFGGTALMVAAVKSVDPNVITLLLKNGADPSIEADIGGKKLKAIDLIERNEVLKNNAEILNALRVSADVTPAPEVKPTPAPKPKPLTDAAFIELCKTGTAQAVEEAIKAGTKVDTRDKNRSTALMFAARYNANPDMIVSLIKNGANVSAKDKNNDTALIWAARYNANPEVTAALLKGGADAKARNKGGKKAVDYASQNANLKDTDIYQQLRKATGK